MDAAQQRAQLVDSRIADFSLLGLPIQTQNMLRLPTRGFDGKANLHEGAVEAGIDIATGVTGHGVWHNEIVDRHPDTGAPIGGIAIPDWDRLLELAAGCHELTGLGYLGVDVVLDRDLGSLILELNARPGLAVQVANGASLRERVDRIEAGQPKGPISPAERAAFAQELMNLARRMGV